MDNLFPKIDMLTSPLSLNSLLGIDFTELAAQAWTELHQDISQFVAAVDWDEPFLIGLAVFHLTTMLWIVSIRKNQAKLLSTIIVLGVMVLLGEQLNKLASKHYLAFSKQNYFDDSGVFTVILYSLPMIANILVSLAFVVWGVLMLMIKAKRSQLRKTSTQPTKVGKGISK
ncbi:hypothetical protein BASA50_008817 [Batrachochytrium salamandrivorans]|uniref:Transmembrane protein 18 n=1 Tax=Batrachochytrium salamandrivorans TaxID=1357716 RepID=A0ABQ8F2Z6_9FUNG|nr:hypothetical protein BASA62_004094 [Batrachochytrium salamandrivorans]KAH6591239.1 hypothetical protein BASA50_008817 [Batrachochytrium salamandrivorans]KAH9268733.1 hypothetical protein BASA83_009217 [Batrachochytrium salamandrivorans]